MVTGIVLLLLALVELSKQQEVAREKAIQYVADIQPDYSVTEQIYANIEAANRAQNSPVNQQSQQK